MDSAEVAVQQAATGHLDLERYFSVFDFFKQIDIGGFFQTLISLLVSFF